MTAQERRRRSREVPRGAVAGKAAADKSTGKSLGRQLIHAGGPQTLGGSSGGTQ